MEVNLKKEGLKVLGGLVYILIFLAVIKYFSLNMYWVYGILLVTSIVPKLYTKTFKFKGFIITSITLALILLLIRYLAGYGFIISTAAICGIILYTRRKRFIEVKQHIESMIWGEPLNEFTKRGEKPPKLSFR